MAIHIFLQHHQIGWKSLKIRIVRPLRGGRLRLRLRRNIPWYVPTEDVYPIDAELTCTVDQAEKLKCWIRAWMSADQY